MTDAASARPGVGTFVCLVRGRRGMSQRALSRCVGRSSAYVQKFEAGAIDPSLSAFAAIAVALHLNPLEVWVLVRLANPVTPDLYTGSSLPESMGAA